MSKIQRTHQTLSTLAGRVGCPEDQTEAARDTWGDHCPKRQILRAVSPANSAYVLGLRVLKHRCSLHSEAGFTRCR